jgi:hypothetical protein
MERWLTLRAHYKLEPADPILCKKIECEAKPLDAMT